MNRKIYISTILIFLGISMILSIYNLDKKQNLPKIEDVLISDVNYKIIENKKDENPVPLQENTKEKTIDIAWKIFEKYLTFNKENDSDGIKNLVYRISDICKDESKKEECKDRMNTAYFFGYELKKEDFKNVWGDERQIIISTDFKYDTEDDLVARSRSVILFVKENEDDKDFKLLSFNPFQSKIMSKKSESEEIVKNKLAEAMKDTDNDIILDYEEECKNTNDTSCQKTDPTKKDTDEDGLWDGTEYFMKKYNPEYK